MKRMKLMLLLAVAATLAGCMIVPLGPYHHGRWHRHYSDVGASVGVSAAVGQMVVDMRRDA